MLYLRNINQTWHGAMVRYLKDAFATGNDIYPTSLPNAYRFLDDWKTRHRVKGSFAGKGDGVTLANTQERDQEGKHDPRFVIPGRERTLCWDCGYYGHRRGNKVCPNYDPSKRNRNRGGADDSKSDTKKEQTNVTGDSGIIPAPNTGETKGQASTASSVTWTAPAEEAAKNESISCTIADCLGEQNFIFLQGDNMDPDPSHYILLDNQSTCHVFKDPALSRTFKRHHTPSSFTAQPAPVTRIPSDLSQTSPIRFGSANRGLRTFYLLLGSELRGATLPTTKHEMHLLSTGRPEQ